MDERMFPVLRHHRLAHLPELKVDPALFDAVFSEECSMANCNAHCCREGVLVDIRERDNILMNASFIHKHLEPDQEHNPGLWFDGQESDGDFPSGFCVGTRATKTGCVFLDRRGRCTLQKVEELEGMGRFALKPFYCVAHPLSIESSVLRVADSEFTNRDVCCSTVAQGRKNAIEVCREELSFMLGEEGLSELESIQKTHP